MRGMNCRGLRLEWVAALAFAMVLPATTAWAQSVGTSTSISVASSQSSAQTNPAAAVCSLTTVTVGVTSSSGVPSGTVTIEDEASGTPVSIGSQTLSTTGTASFTFALANGSHTLIAAYGGSTAYTASNSVSVAQSISSQCSAQFAVTVSSLSPSNTLTAGQLGTGVVTITPLPAYLASLDGAPAFITVSCSGLPSLATCTLSPDDLEIAPGQNQGVISSLVIQTQAENTSRTVPPGHRSSPIAWAFLLPGMLGLGGLAWGTRKRPWLNRLALVALVGLVTTLSTTACNPLYYYYNHGPPATPATPSGTYTVTITGQSSNGVTANTNSTTMTLTVN